MRRRDMYLVRYLNEHIGEKKTAREIFNELQKVHKDRSGFKDPHTLAVVLLRYRKPLKREKGRNVYLI